MAVCTEEIKRKNFIRSICFCFQTEINILNGMLCTMYIVYNTQCTYCVTDSSVCVSSQKGHIAKTQTAIIIRSIKSCAQNLLAFHLINAKKMLLFFSSLLLSFSLSLTVYSLFTFKYKQRTLNTIHGAYFYSKYLLIQPIDIRFVNKSLG